MPVRAHVVRGIVLNFGSCYMQGRIGAASKSSPGFTGQQQVKNNAQNYPIDNAERQAAARKEVEEKEMTKQERATHRNQARTPCRGLSF